MVVGTLSPMWFHLAVFALGVLNTACETRFQSEFLKLDSLFNGKPYDRRATPTQNTGKATHVSVEMYLRSFGSISPVEMHYSADLYLRQRWIESRFINNSLTRPLDVSDPNLMKKIWKPEVYFPNAKWGDFQYVSVPNVLIRLHPDGRVLYMLRLQLLFSCMMDLTNYPLDSQHCTIELAVFSKTTRELLLSWYETEPIKMYSKLRLPQFKVIEVKSDSCRRESQFGNYSCLEVSFHLNRNMGYHIVQSYIPSTLIVVISWVSFWLDVDSIPSRVTLGVTTLLSICSESSGTPDKMPPVSYMKALDVWMGVCTAFIFLALLEFTVVVQLSRQSRETLSLVVQVSRGMSQGVAEIRRVCGDDCALLKHILKKRKEVPSSPRDSVYVEVHVTGEVRKSNESVPACRCQQRLLKATNIDRVSRIVFPLVFCVFNIVYWIYYRKV